jgi:hypothetical protein
MLQGLRLAFICSSILGARSADSNGGDDGRRRSEAPLRPGAGSYQHDDRLKAGTS